MFYSINSLQNRDAHFFGMYNLADDLDSASVVYNPTANKLSRNDVYGYGHACPVYLKEINQQIDKMYNPYTATSEERRIRRDLRDYANAIYHPV